MQRRILACSWLVGSLAAVLGGAAGCDKVDSLLCTDAGCNWSEREWATLAGLAGLPETPPPDRSNKHLTNPNAERLGQKFFFDTRWSGLSTQVDVLRRPVGYARVNKGQPTNLSCASCHNMNRGGIDTESQPGNVSIGAAWADTNASSVFNAAFYSIHFWNGRSDSLWAQAVAVIEGTNMNGNRLNNLWVISEHYRDEFMSVFPDYPLPALGARAAVEALVETTGARAGQCKFSGNTCPTSLGCREVVNPDTSAKGCFPRFPLNGKPGVKAGCQPDDASEPFGDAFDCMDAADQEPVSRALINYGKAVAAYEYRLVSRDSAFDRYVEGVAKGWQRDHNSFPVAAERGARLFIGKAACNDCHATPLLSDSKFHNIGLPQIGQGVPTEGDCPAGGLCDCVSVTPERMGNNCLPWGAVDGLDKLGKNKLRRDLRWSDDTSDLSRASYLEMKPNEKLKGAYRTPSLRDVALTAPYMHNGALPTLEAVIEHYNDGGSGNAPGARSAQIRPLFLTEGEKSDLIAFLKTLTGAPIPAQLTAAPPAQP